VLSRSRLPLTTACVALAALACSDALEQDTAAGLVVAVVNARSNTVSLVDATRLTAGTPLDLAPSSSTARSIAARGNVILVPLGDANAVGVVWFGMGPPSAPSFILLRSGSGATGVAIVDDSLAWVANPGLNTATRINYRTGDTLPQRSVGAAPRAVVSVDDFVFVVNSNMPGLVPVGPSWLSRFHCCGAGVTDSIPLTGTNARYATLGTDGLLYVVLAGTPGAADGKLSIVDPVAGRELAVVNGLGESPGPAVYHPSGRLLVASTTHGILEVNTLTRSVTRGPGDAIKPEGAAIAALALDPRGRVYAAAAGSCAGPGVLHILSAPPAYRVIETVGLGVCPSAAVLAAVPVAP
jgi:streptogramin lyase